MSQSVFDEASQPFNFAQTEHDIIAFWKEKGIYHQSLEQRREAPPEPQLQTHPLKDMDELRAAERTMLDHYAWVDQEAGVVRIPIERALELTAERGLPSRAAK